MTVFIGLPVYNGESGIASALESLLHQTYTDISILVSDNCSTDRTHQIASSYARLDSRVRVVRAEANQGPTWNFNALLDASETAPFFMWAAHDDVWAPGYVEACVGVLETNPLVVLCGTEAAFVDADGKPTGEIDAGLSTVGLKPVQRAVKYLQEVERNSIFYGIYRRSAIGGRRLRDTFGNDQLFLFDLCLSGEIVTLPSQLLTRRIGGTSRTAKTIYKSLGSHRRWSARFFRVDVYRSFLRCVADAGHLSTQERLALRSGVLRTLIQRHVLANLTPARFWWWVRHAGTNHPRSSRSAQRQ